MGDDWHKEEYAFNNRAYRSLTVDADRNNPLLDVTFDGVHILNGDIVSPTPEIVMELKVNVNVVLKKKNGLQLVELDFLYLLRDI